MTHTTPVTGGEQLSIGAGGYGGKHTTIARGHKGFHCPISYVKNPHCAIKPCRDDQPPIQRERDRARTIASVTSEFVANLPLGDIPNLEPRKPQCIEHLGPRIEIATRS